MTDARVMQGDLMLVRLTDEQVAKLESFLAKKKTVAQQPEVLVLAKGEGKGHHHQIESGVEVAWEVESDENELHNVLDLDFIVDQARGLANKENFKIFRVGDTELIHRNVITGEQTTDHGSAPVEAGTYIAINQVEDSFGRLQRVMD